MNTKLLNGIIGVAVLTRVLAGSVASSAWTASGSRSGHIHATVPLTTIDVSASTTAHLYPGARGEILLTVDNPNRYAVTVTGIATDGAITSDHGAWCDAATGVTYAPPSSTSLVVPALTDAQFALPGVAMSDDSDNACQGASFTIPLRLTAQS
jgi:hypothetical protein